MSEHTDVHDVRAMLAGMVVSLKPELQAAWEAYFHKYYGKVPQELFQGAYHIASMNLSAQLAVDLGMPRETWLASAGEAYDLAFASAPKFG